MRYARGRASTGFPMDDLIINLLGPTQVLRLPDAESGAASAIPPPSHPSRQVAHLLAYLVLGGRGTYERDELADLFWGDQGMERARRSLSTAVWRLRKTIEPEPVPHGTYLATHGGEALGFNWESRHRIDVIEFESVLDRHLSVPPQRLGRADATALADGLALYRGDFLSGGRIGWALTERERLAERYLDGLSHLMRHKFYVGEYQQGIQIGQRILERDPLREDIHRDLMRLHVRAGHRSRAIRQYRDCSDVLERELQIAPDAETRNTYDEIRRGDPQAAAEPAPVPDRAPEGFPDLDPQPTPDQALVYLTRALAEVERARRAAERVFGRDRTFSIIARSRALAGDAAGQRQP